MPRIAIVLVMVAALAATSLRFALGGDDLTTERVSLTNADAEAMGNSTSAAVTSDGRYVAFASSAENIVPSDDNHVRDMFVRDRVLGTTERASVATGGGQGNSHSSGLGAGGPTLSSDARFVAFASSADNLVPNDMNESHDVFVRDRLLATTQRVSVATDGTEGDNDSVSPAISGEGRYVTFSSSAATLIADDGNGDRDVFLHDRMTGTTELISIATDGTRGNFSSGGLGAGPATISTDGRYVVYGSFANNLVANDSNGWDDIFVRDRVAGTTERVSVNTAGVEGNGHSIYPSISDDGRYVAFASLGDNFDSGDKNPHYDIYLRDRQLGTTTWISKGEGGQLSNGPSRFVAISDDGGWVAYQSDASNLLADDGNGAATDVFRFEVQTGATKLMSIPAAGGSSNGASGLPAISGDGQIVPFESFANNLVPSDMNGSSDIFARAISQGPSPTATATRTPTRTATRTPTRTPTTTSFRRGDANCDGRADSIDAALILQYDAGLLASLPCPSAADANGDGSINAIDSAIVLQIVAGFLPA